MTERATRTLAAVLIGVAVAAITAGALSIYRNGPGMPIGADTPHHVWRMRLVTEEGLDALPSFRDSHLLNANGDRPGLPVLAATVFAAGGPDATGLAFVFPAVAAALVALGGATVALRGVGGSPIGSPLYCVAGASVPVAFAANGSFEQLLASALLVGAVATLVPAVRGDRAAAVASVLLLAGAWTCHWIVTATAVVALLAAALAIAFLPTEEHETPGDRRRAALVVLAIVGAAVVSAAAISWLAPGAPLSPLGVSGEAITDNLDRQLPAYVRSVAFPLALIGAIALWRLKGRSRVTLAFLVVAAGVPLAGAAALWAGAEVPLHRLLSSALAIPLLAAAGAVGLAGWIGGSRRVRGRVVLGGAVATVLIGVVAAHAWVVLDRRPPATPEPGASQLAAVGRALGSTDRPVILAVENLPEADPPDEEEGFGTILALRRLRAVVPADLISRTAVYLGDPERLLAGEPTLRPEVQGYDEVSLDAWRAVEQLADERPLVLVFAAYSERFDEVAVAHPGWLAAPWLLVTHGGLVVPADPPPVTAPTGASLARQALVTLGVLTIAGLGWSLGLGGRDVLAAVLLAPVIGVALLVTVGLAAGAAGADLGGSGGRVLTVGVAAAGLLLAGLRRRRGTLASPTDPDLSGARSG